MNQRLLCLGLFTELDAVGGIQRGSRHAAAVLANLARNKGLGYKFLSLNDQIGDHESQVGELSFQFTGFGRVKSRFVASAISAAAANPRLIFVAHVNLGPVGWLAKKRARAKMAMIGWGVEVWDSLPWIRRKALQSSEALLAISKFTAARFVDVQNAAPEAIHLLPLALDPSFWRAATGDVPARPAWFPNGRVMLSVARLDASEGYKGVDTMIRALQRIQVNIPDARYVLVGDGDDRPRLEKLADDLGVAERVHFAGTLDGSGAELIGCYAHCDVFVLPSKQEGFGIVFLEAMAFGKPVIGGDYGGTPDIIEDGETGFLVTHGDVERLASVAETLLSDQSLRQTIGLRAQASVKGHYLFECFQDRLKGILEGLHLL